MANELEGFIGKTPMKGDLDLKTGHITFKPVEQTGDEYKFAKKLEKILDSLTFSLYTLAGIIAHQFTPVLQIKMFYFVQHLINHWQSQWQTEDYHPDMTDVLIINEDLHSALDKHREK